MSTPHHESAYPTSSLPSDSRYPAMSAPPLYPRVAHPVGTSVGPAAAAAAANPFSVPHRIPHPSQQSAGSAVYIAVTMKHQRRMDPPPSLAPSPAVPHAQVSVEFDCERQYLAEVAQAQESRRAAGLAAGAVAMGNNRDSGLPAALSPSVAAAASKFERMGLDRTAVLLALAVHGDDEAKVIDFCSAYAQLSEMGFSPAAVAGSLAISDNSSERALSLLVV